SRRGAAGGAACPPGSAAPCPSPARNWVRWAFSFTSTDSIAQRRTYDKGKDRPHQRAGEKEQDPRRPDRGGTGRAGRPPAGVCGRDESLPAGPAGTHHDPGAGRYPAQAGPPPSKRPKIKGAPRAKGKILPRAGFSPSAPRRL